LYYNFNPNLPEPLNVIHPLQINAVKKLLSLEIPDEIDFIFLFGSSLELACGVHSDIDLMVITENPDHENVYGKMKNLCKKLDRKCDILISNKNDFIDNLNDIGTVENRMKERGICLYAKKKGYIA